jgi:ribosomal protein S18 acetylase RimI-like enzyme
VTACSIRRATSKDVPALVELLCALFAIETDFAVQPRRHARGLSLLLGQARRRRAVLLVATLDGQVVGMASVQTVISTAEGGLSGWVEDVVVAAERRGQGIGQRLMTAVASWAQSHGVRRLQLVADQRNRSALTFYGRLGYTRTHMVTLRAPRSKEAARVR